MYTYHGLGPALWFLSLWRQGVEWVEDETMGILSGDKVPLEDNGVPLAENCI